MKIVCSKILNIFLLLLLTFHVSPLFSQVNYEPLNKTIYKYLDRLSIQGYFQLNTEIKPFSRVYIAKKLKIILEDNSKDLSPLEKDELIFYTQEFARELKRLDVNVDSILADKGNNLNLWNVVGFNEYGRFHLVDYDDSLFTFTLDPILGYKYGSGNITSETHLWNGLSMYGRISDWVGFDLNFRDNTETGDNIDYTRDFSPLTGFTLLLVNPGFSVSTAWVYKNFTLTRADKDSNLSDSRENDGMLGYCRPLYNDLETVTIEHYPEIAAIKRFMLESGASDALMSGSGPTVFGIFPDQDDGENSDLLGCAAVLVEKYGAGVFVTKPLN